MVITQLETKYEHDMLILAFDNSSLPTRAFIGLSLKKSKSKQVIMSATGQTIPYKVKFSPGSPSGDGTCLEIVRQNGITAINDLSCVKHRFNFICEKYGNYDIFELLLMMPTKHVSSTVTEVVYDLKRLN